MSSGFMPAYSYRPPSFSDPSIDTRSARRSRLIAGGTYFRSREVGIQQNNISIQVIEYEVSGDLYAICVVTNHNIDLTENITGPVTPTYLKLNIKWNERYKIDSLTTNPHAILLAKPENSVSEIVVRDLGNVDISSLFYEKGKTHALWSLKALEIGPLSEIILKKRVKIYELLPKTVTDSTTSETFIGWDISDLREQINENDPWVEMLERSGADPITGLPPEPKFDEQDDGVDGPVLAAFNEAYLAGGDGLPAFPNAEDTGPTRSLIHLNYSERQNGTLGVENRIYEWQGTSTQDGSWIVY